MTQNILTETSIITQKRKKINSTVISSFKVEYQELDDGGNVSNHEKSDDEDKKEVKERPKLLQHSASSTGAIAAPSQATAPTQGAADQPVEEDEAENDDPTGKKLNSCIYVLVVECSARSERKSHSVSFQG